MDASRGGPPVWAPGSVRAAARRGTGTDEDLFSGRAWNRMLETLQRTGDLMRSEPAPGAPLDRAAGYQHLLALIALGVDEALRSADPSDPHLVPGATDAVLKWGMDCPDALYLGAPLRGDCVYRVHGSRGTARYLGFQVMKGMETVANAVADDFVNQRDGSIDITLSADRQPGNWLPLPERSSTLIVRQFFYDWTAEEAARLAIERVGGVGDTLPPAPPEPSAVARQLIALGEFVDASVRFWMQTQERLRGQGPNRFAEPSARTDLGGAAENVTVWGAWELDDDEALIVEFVQPGALYWSISLGNYWWESIDYANHQSSLNGHQASLEAGGVFRAVIAHRDPGVANWLDTAGQSRGPMIVRYVRAAQTPVPATRVVPFDSLDEVIPETTARVTPAERRAAIARRRGGVAKRFQR